MATAVAKSPQPDAELVEPSAWATRQAAPGRIELAVDDRAGQRPRSAEEHHRDPVAAGDDTVQGQHVAELPAADLAEAREQDPPQREEGQVVPDHERGLEPERAAQRQARAQVRREQGARELERGSQPRHR
jgi:hypothetical protein